jgi:shikimate dehydrogenase
MTNYALIGKSLAHSFSKSYFENKFDDLGLAHARYHNVELENINAIKSVLSTIENLRGFNVTIPFKQSIIPHLDELTNEAAEIKAVNCVSIVDGKWIGHNTDVYGFAQSIKPFLDANHERALILGTGGASSAVAFALKKIGVDVFFVSRNPTNQNTLNYTDINEQVMGAFKCVVNTTPVGMFPDESKCPDLPYHFFTEKHLAYDLIYNPAQTLFLKRALSQGSIVVNGLSMLQLQAEKSWEIWTKK